MTERLFKDQASLIATLAGDVAARLNEAVVERDRAGLVVTGGTTPAALYDDLGHRETPWERVWVTLSDERWVDADSGDSNEHLVRERLLRGPAARAHFVALKSEHRTPAEAAPVIAARIATMPRPFDVVILGMGADGHIASLFPGNPSLAQGGPSDVVAVEQPGAAGSPHRLSLTLAALAEARWTALMITGPDKLNRLRMATGAPIQALLAQAPVEVYWAP